MSFNESNKLWIVVPKQTDKIVNLLLWLSEQQEKKFFEIIQNLQTVAASEIWHSGGTGENCEFSEEEIWFFTENSDKLEKERSLLVRKQKAKRNNFAKLTLYILFYSKMAVGTQALESAKKKESFNHTRWLLPETIYKFSPVFLKSSWRLAFSADGVTNALANGDRFVGIAEETKTSIAAWTETILTWRQGSYLLKFSNTLTQWNVGDNVYSNNTSGDDVVTITSATGSHKITIWKIVEFVSANYAYVAIDNFIDSTAANGA